MKYIVKIVNYESAETVKSFECDSDRRAERISDGVSINLNHDQFYVITDTQP